MSVEIYTGGNGIISSRTILGTVEERSPACNKIIEKSYVSGYVPELGSMHQGLTGLETEIIRVKGIKVHKYNVVEK